MGFLAPLFFAALAALSIPVLIHLTHRERREPVVFPSLMFLQRIPFRTHRRQRIRHWFLFFLRAAAVALLAFAFARPFVQNHAAGTEGHRNVVLLLDRSASMQARGRWGRATAAARDALSKLAGARAAVVAFDDHAEGLTELTADHVALDGALARVTPGSAAGRYASALQTAAAMLERSGGGEVVLVSDFQRAGWDGSAAARLPAGVVLRTVDVGDTMLVNTAVTGVVLDRQAGAEPRTVITARLAAMRGVTRDVPVTLTVDGRTVQTVAARVTPGTAAIARFAVLRDPETARRARVAIPADDQPADDGWQFVYGPAPRIGVLLLSRADATPRDILYAREALGVARDPALPVTLRMAAALRTADLAGAGVVIVHDAPFPVGDAGRRLLDWVRGGGGLFVALGARGSLPREIADSLGAAAGVVDRGDLGAALALTDAAHPIFAGWGDRADLGAGRAFRYRRLERARTALLRYDDGAPALAEMRLGAGRVVVWTADLANKWSDVPLRAAFVPLMQGIVAYAAGFEPPAASRLVGEIVEQRRDERGEGRVIVQSPGGARRELTSGESGFALRDRGFYTVQRSPLSSLLLIAANVPPTESDPARLVPEQLAAAVSSGASAGAPALAGVEGPAEQERGQRLWWFVLAAVLLLLAAETGVAHRARGTA